MKLAGLEWGEVQDLIADFLASGQKIELPATFESPDQRNASGAFPPVDVAIHVI